MADYIIKPANREDSRRIWEIRNHPIVRKNSVNSEKISFSKHIGWFDNKYFESQDNKCFVLEKEKKVMGYCRFDLKQNKYRVSIAVDANFHGQGLGNLLLSQSLKLLKTNKEIMADIRLKNNRSIKLFLKNSFAIYHQDSRVFYLKFNPAEDNFSKKINKLYDLILKQSLERSQAIIWLQGDRNDRAKKVFELYKQGYAGKILITGNNKLIGKNIRPEENNISLENMASWLVRRGVSKQKIIIDNNSFNTKEQAENVINLAKVKGWKSIILVASSYHQPRAFLTFLNQAKRLVWRGKIINAPAPIEWQEKPSGRTKSAWQYFSQEKEKIKKYKKDIALPSEGIKYLNNITK